MQPHQPGRRARTGYRSRDHSRFELYDVLQAANREGRDVLLRLNVHGVRRVPLDQRTLTRDQDLARLDCTAGCEVLRLSLTRVNAHVRDRDGGITDVGFVSLRNADHYLF